MDVVITELGGTVGDIESQPFLEAIRQFRQEVGPRNAINIHLTLVPFIAASGELKTKPTQHSVREMRSIGIQPDLLVCRCADGLPQDVRRKIALFCNVDEECVSGVCGAGTARDCCDDIPCTTDTCDEEGIGIIAFCPLAQGLLTSRYLEGIPDDSRAGREGSCLDRDRVSEGLLDQVRNLDAVAQERGQILEVANEPEFASMAPSQIVPALADRGLYLASESSFYRILREADQLARRGKAKPPARQRPRPLQASAANQLWSWDITYLATTVKGLFFYLYLIMDVYSRKIVGWEVFSTESAQHAASVFHKAHLREGVGAESLALHSDNGSPMKGATMLATLQRLGVMPSFSRPSVSNDNPYSEALFKTLKYHPGFPDKPFNSLQDAREWVAGFQHWYNEVHRHSALKFVTPGQRHRGEDIAILAQRNTLYAEAKVQRPERWSGATRNWEHEEVVFLNPNKSTEKEGKLKDKVA